MIRTEAALLRGARRSYELGRLDRGLRRALLLTPVLFLPVACCVEPAVNVLCGLGLVAAVAFCLWRGESWGRGILPGLASGTAPLLVPLAMHATGHVCHGGRCLMSSWCVLAGVAGGVVLGLFARRLRDAGGEGLVAASLVAGLLGSVGCLAYGLVGFAGMAAGMAAGALPILVLRRA
ncbi:MAG TPA: hypothetical protein VGQ67_13735 [Candidatus Polarisedimenticolia bacterium]|jgi:hypothetical protein|nr:hypothetical protein [Candidatus Polarisedimenticolia bacterium]